MSDNPMRRANEALALHPRCGAHCRTTGQPCRSYAMANGRCRMHGGKSPGAPRGEAHGNYRHGRQTIEAQDKRREWRETLRVLRGLINSES